MDFQKNMTRRKLLTRSSGLAGVAIVAAACGTDGDTSNAAAVDSTDGSAAVDSPTAGQPAVIDPATIPRGETIDFGPVPDVPEGPLSPELAAAVATLWGGSVTGRVGQAEIDALTLIGESLSLIHI